MLSNFQKKKFAYHFKITDLNSDGFLTRDDFYNYGIIYADLIGENRSLCVQQEINLWNKIHECLGTDVSSAINVEQYVRALSVVISTSSFLSTFLWDYINLAWKCRKLSGELYFSYDLFIKVMFLNKSSNEARSIFNALDTENKSGLTIHELYYYCFSFFYSNNVDCPSKWVFGKFDF